MRNILFILPNMEHGGTGRSLENLLKLLNREKYCCKVVCTNPNSHGYYEEIFKDYLIQWPKWFQLFLNNLFLLKTEVFFHRYFNVSIWYFIYKYAVNSLVKKYHIDVVVGYQENRPTLLASAFSGKSIVWVHCVFSRYIEVHRKTDACCYHRADDIVCVSHYAERVMKEVMPREAHKTCYIYNLLDVQGISAQAQQPTDDARFKSDKFTIVSIGRYSREKQFEKIPEIAKKVIDAGANDFRWYIIGDGSPSLIHQTEQKIKDWHLEDHVILLGSKDNPYAYIAKSHLLISTSLNESWSYVLNEAKVPHIPVLTTDFAAAVESVNPDNGIITPIEDMHTALTKLITNEGGIYQTLAESSAKQYYDNAPMLKQIEDLLG